MKKLLILFVFLSILVTENFNLISLGPPCYPEVLGSYFYVPFNSNEPPLSTDMPIDVMIGYIALDSVVMNGRYNQLYNFIGNLSYGDTLKKIMRYWYQLIEWDPYRFHTYCTYSRFKFPKINLNEIIWSLTQRIKRVSPQPFIDIALLTSSVIAHIKVIDTTFFYDPSGGCSHLYAVSCIILDTLKGRILPKCTEYYSNNNNLILSSLQPNCLIFDYCLSWNKGQNWDVVVQDSSLYLFDEEGKPWIKKGEEYIVFLQEDLICDDSLGIYYSFGPAGLPMSYYFCMYPIKDGIVYDYKNEFGLGTMVQVNSFKAFLRQKINELKNY